MHPEQVCVTSPERVKCSERGHKYLQFMLKLLDKHVTDGALQTGASRTSAVGFTEPRWWLKQPPPLKRRGKIMEKLIVQLHSTES